jgi:hypothetical protein
MDVMDDRPSYEEWLKAVARDMERSRGLFGGARDVEPAGYDATGHPIDPPFPPTGDADYDAHNAHRQLHSDAAKEAAGFDLRELDRVRRALDAGEGAPLPPGWMTTRAGRETQHSFDEMTDESGSATT